MGKITGQNFISNFNVSISLCQNDKTVDFAKVVMGKISGTISARGDGETKVTVALETLCVINTKQDSRHYVKK